MADLDEISMKLGEISSDIKHVLRWQEQHECADQQRFDELAERITVNNGYRFRLEALEDAHELHKPVIDQVKRLRWLAAGFAAGLAVVGGAFGSWLTNAMKWFS